jgi:histidinol-phosphate aminotransferase
MHFLSLANQGVQKLTPYQPGKPIEELQRELGLLEVTKLASNENPLGPSPIALAAIKSALAEIARYPDGNSFKLKRLLAERLGVEPAQITLGNGSNDILEIVPRVFANADSEIIYSQYAFAVYPLATMSVGAKAVVTPARNWGHDLHAMLMAVTPATKVIYIANPNNPTGTWLDKQSLGDFLANVPAKVIVVLDEAYSEYVSQPNYPNGLHYLSQFPNLVVTRTFSKAYGLAGLRVGYSISHPDIADLLNRVRQPFNLNILAQEAALAVLEDTAYLKKSVQVNDLGLVQLSQGLANLGVHYIPSVANFITFKVGIDAGKVYQEFLKRGVIVRPLANYDMAEYLRVSVGLQQENIRFLEILRELMLAKANTES